MLANHALGEHSIMTDSREGHDSRAVANELLRIARSQNITLTIMQLIKLAFFAHGWSLAVLGRPLTKDAPQAWQYGPVFPLIYKSYTGTGSSAITEPIKDKKTDIEITESFEPAEIEVMKSVVNGYGRMHAYELSNITHAPGSPWDTTLREKGLYSPIPNDVIRSYFNALKAHDG